MNESDKRLIAGAVTGLLLVLLLVQGAIRIHESVNDWEARAKNQETIRDEVATLAQRVKAARVASKGGQSAPQSGGEEIGSLLPWLEKESAALQLTDKMQQISPVAVKGNETGLYREKADLNFKALPMETAIRFLDRLESNPRIRIVRGEVKRAEKEAPGVILFLEIGLL